MEVLDVGQERPATLPLITTEDMLTDVDLCHKRPSTLSLEIRGKLLMLKGEVYIGLRPATIPPLTNVNVVDCLIFQEIVWVVMGGLDKGPIPDNLPS